MAFSPVVALSALEDLQKEATQTFSLFHPAMSEIIERGQLMKAQGPEVTFVITPDGPGFVTPILHGDEVLPTGAKENSVKARETSGTATYSYTIKERDIMLLGGKQDIVRLLKDYPINALNSFKQRVAKQFVQGNDPELSTLPTLNAQKTYEPIAGYGARNGFLAFAAPEAQTGSVHGVARNSVLNWHNQHEEITSFRTDGTFRIRRALRRTAQQGLSQGGVDILLCDNATFDNYMRFNDDKTIFVDAPGTDKNKNAAFRGGLSFMDGGTRIVADPFIDLSDMQGAAAQGTAYGLDLDVWEFFTHSGSHDGVNVKSGWFENRSPEKLQLQLAYHFLTVLTFGAICRDLRRNLTIVGGARE